MAVPVAENSLQKWLSLLLPLAKSVSKAQKMDKRNVPLSKKSYCPKFPNF